MAVALALVLQACDSGQSDFPALTPGERQVRVATPKPPSPTAAPEGAIDATSYGAAAGRDSRAAIQAALDAAGPGGSVTVPSASQAYLLTSAGANPLNPGGQYALRIPAGVTLHIAAGARLRLADGQQSDELGPVDVIVWDADDVTVTGGGTVEGNTAGQPWTGGHRQVVAGCLLRSFLPARRATIQDLHLLDSFSNPVHVESESDVILRRLVTADNGEGPQVMFADGVIMEDLVHTDRANVAVGDGVEVSRVTGFRIRRARVTAGTDLRSGGSAVDVYGSRDGVVEDVYSQGWSVGVDLHDAPDPLSITDNVVVRRALFDGGESSAIVSGPTAGTSIVEDVAISRFGIAAQVRGSDPSAITIRRAHITETGLGVLLYGARRLVVEGGYCRGATELDGVLVERREPGPAPSLELLDFDATGGARYGVAVDNRGDSTFEPPVHIRRGDFRGNAAGAFYGLPRSAVIEGTIPPP